MGTMEGYYFHHVQAIMLSIDQYAETALGNRNYFLNKPRHRRNEGQYSLEPSWRRFFWPVMRMPFRARGNQSTASRLVLITGMWHAASNDSRTGEQSSVGHLLFPRT